MQPPCSVRSPWIIALCRLKAQEVIALLAPQSSSSRFAISLDEPMMRHIPNALFVFRMLLVALIAWLLARGLYWETLWVFGIAALTDGLDGFLAKRFGWTSELGKILDPLADKILLVSVFVILGALGLVPTWLAVSAVLRDLTIT